MCECAPTCNRTRTRLDYTHGQTQLVILRLRLSTLILPKIQWIANGYHGEMGFLAREDRLARRRDLAAILPEVKAVIVTSLVYWPVCVCADSLRMCVNVCLVLLPVPGSRFMCGMRDRGSARARLCVSIHPSDHPPACRCARVPAPSNAARVRRDVQGQQGFPSEQQESGRGIVSCYAWGDDYHDILGAKLRALAEWLHSRAGGRGRWYVGVYVCRCVCM